MPKPADTAPPLAALPVPAPLFVLGGAVSTQVGSALAVHAFREVGPVGVAFGRIAFAAAVLGLLTRLAHSSRRPVAGAWRATAVFAVALATMNSLFYLALDRIPLGVAVTLEFWGPIAVAVATSRRRRDLLWAALAAGGVALLGGGFGGARLVGVLLALAAGTAWIAYILAGRRVAALWPGSAGLATAMALATGLLAPLAVALDGSALVRPNVLALCLGVGVLASAIPYGLEQAAMRRMPARTFSVLLALHPAVAAAVGALVLGQALSWREALAIPLVIAAGIGAIRSSAVDV